MDVICLIVFFWFFIVSQILKIEFLSNLFNSINNFLCRLPQINVTEDKGIVKTVIFPGSTYFSEF